jgi:hypothetical protein
MLVCAEWSHLLTMLGGLCDSGLHLLLNAFRRSLLALSLLRSFALFTEADTLRSTRQAYRFGMNRCMLTTCLILLQPPARLVMTHN